MAFLSISNIHGQGERDFWYFGQLAGMHYTGGSYENLSDNNIPRNVFLGIIEGPDNLICATDDKGNLLFYSDGRTFKNKFHENLLNSPTDEYAFRESQAAVARDPSNADRYYVFITIMDGIKNRLTYTVVDMSMNNGRGGLVPDKKHILMANDTGQHMVIAQHANGIDAWLICIRKSRYYAYLITENGISSSPVTSQAGFSFVNGSAIKFGNMEVSPDNKLIVTGFPLFAEESGGFTSKVLLSSFNNLNGRLNLIFEDSEPTEPMASIPSSGIEFSSNSKVFYSAYVGGAIKQYDLSNLENIPSPVTIIEAAPFPYLKRGPDGQIFSIKRGDEYIGSIKEPNVLGLDCDYQSNVLNLSGSNLLDLPTFLPPKYPEGISYKNICEGEAMEFYYTSSLRDPTYRWDLGDGSIANGENVFHTYNAPGTYTVTVEAIDNDTNTIFYSDTKDVTIYASPVINQPADIYICSENTTIYFSNYDLDILSELDSSAFKVSYFLSENDALTLSSEEFEIIPEIGTKTIWVRVQNLINPQCYDIKSFEIITPEYIDLNIPEIQYICNDRAGLILEAPDDFLSYAWSNGEMTQNIQVFTPGIYTLTVVKDFGDFTCEAQARISVRVGDELPEILEIKVIDWSQYHNSIEVILDRTGNYEFSADGINFQESPILKNLPFKEDYKVYVRDVDCQKTIESETLFLLYYDKFFTPNGDGRHDYWRVINNFREEDIEIQIFNRYGKLLETMSDYDRGWDGTSDGVKMPTSDYWFRVVRQNGKVHHGHFTLKR
ncbi:MAG: T9SS type B sorting domain-containing protein [Winogradskyella sp.]|nr:MAG: T9SS type B sorting domain-containing protein [Winogradskyella sp.]